MIEGKDYLLVEDDLHPDQFLIKLTSGGFAGTVYRYGAVSIIEEKDQARLKFMYEIKSVPEYSPHTITGLKDNTIFNNHIGEVLSDIILNNDYTIGTPND